VQQPARVTYEIRHHAQPHAPGRHRCRRVEAHAVITHDEFRGGVDAPHLEPEPLSGGVREHVAARLQRAPVERLLDGHRQREVACDVDIDLESPGLGGGDEIRERDRQPGPVYGVRIDVDDHRTQALDTRPEGVRGWVQGVRDLAPAFAPGHVRRGREGVGGPDEVLDHPVVQAARDPTPLPFGGARRRVQQPAVLLAEPTKGKAPDAQLDHQEGREGNQPDEQDRAQQTAASTDGDVVGVVGLEHQWTARTRPDARVDLQESGPQFALGDVFGLGEVAYLGSRTTGPHRVDLTR
jgi:hypothetical protein